MTVIELPPDRPRRSTGPKIGNAVILVLPVIRIERYHEDGYELVSEAAQKLVRRSIISYAAPGRPLLIR